MKRLGVGMRPVGHFLLRCLVGKYGTILWMGMLTVMVGAGAYLSLVYDHIGSGRADRGTVYSVAAVDAHLAQDPGSWLGRTIQIRAELVPCERTPSVSVRSCAELTSSSGPSYLDGLNQSQLTTADMLPVMFLSRLESDSLVLHWGAVATYRVQLVAAPDSLCGVGVCAEAGLLDSAP